MAFQALIQLFQASSQPIQAPNWLSGLTSALLDLNSAQTDGRTNGRTKVPLCSTGLRPLRGRCPKSNKINILRAYPVVGLSQAFIEINIGFEILLLGSRALSSINPTPIRNSKFQSTQIPILTADLQICRKN